MPQKLTKIFQKSSPPGSIRLSIRHDKNSKRTSYIYFLSKHRLLDYLRQNPAGHDRYYSLSDQDLTGLDFSHLDLRRTDFTGATLHDTKFHKTRIEDANLTNADLTGAKFDKGQLQTTTGRPRFGPSGPLTAAQILIRWRKNQRRQQK